MGLISEAKLAMDSDKKEKALKEMKRLLNIQEEGEKRLGFLKQAIIELDKDADNYFDKIYKDTGEDVTTVKFAPTYVNWVR